MTTIRGVLRLPLFRPVLLNRRFTSASNIQGHRLLPVTPIQLPGMHLGGSGSKLLRFSSTSLATEGEHGELHWDTARISHQRDQQKHEKDQNGLETDTNNSIEEIAKLIEARDRDKVKQMLDGMRSAARSHPDIRTWNTYISALAKTRKVSSISKAFREMQQHGVKPNLDTFKAVIEACGLAGEPDEMEDIFVLMDKLGVEMNTATYKALRRSLNDDLDTWNTYLSLLGEIDEETLELPEIDGLAQLDMMERDGLKPDVVTYNILIDACGLRGRAYESELIYRRMVERAGVKPNIDTMANLIEAYSRGNEPEREKARVLIRKVEKEGWAVDGAYCNSLIRAYGFMGMPEEAEKVLFEKMNGLGVKVEIEHFNSLLDAWGRNGNVEKFQNCLLRMEGSNGATVCIQKYYEMGKFAQESKDK